MDFNYEKAYFVQAKPAFLNLNNKQCDIFSKVRALVGELNQGRDLNIPLSPAITDFLNELTTLELSQLSNASYFVGHWKPNNTEKIFDNKRGESWKVSNCIDQILRKRLELPYNIEIHEGKFRVTFSSEDCWLWEEFSLATEENLKIFKECNLPFNENALHVSAKKLTAKIGDLWKDVDTLPDNKEYSDFLDNKRKIKKAADYSDVRNGINEEIEHLKKEQKGLLWLLDHGIEIDNCIYYKHTDVFCFGWQDKLNDTAKNILIGALEGNFPYKYEFK